MQFGRATHRAGSELAAPLSDEDCCAHLKLEVLGWMMCCCDATANADVLADCNDNKDKVTKNKTKLQCKKFPIQENTIYINSNKLILFLLHEHLQTKAEMANRVFSVYYKLQLVEFLREWLSFHNNKCSLQHSVLLHTLKWTMNDILIDI